VDLDGCSDDGVAQLGRFGKEWVHAIFTEGNEGNEGALINWRFVLSVWRVASGGSSVHLAVICQVLIFPSSSFPLFPSVKIPITPPI